MREFLIAAVAGYLLGSIPFGYLLVRIFCGEDVRSSGSGNIGATNVARKSPALGVATLLLDAGKGLAAVLFIRHFFGADPRSLLLVVAAFSAVAGHMFPVWLNFRGGKGVATGLGSFAVIAPKSILCMAGVFLLVVAISRYVSLGSVAAAALLPILAWTLGECTAAAPLALMVLTSTLIVWKHRQNLGRIRLGTEHRLGARTP